MTTDQLVLGDGGVLPQKDMAVWLARQQGVVGEQHRLETLIRKQWDIMVCESWRPFRRNGSMDWIEGSPLIYAQHVGQVRLVSMLAGAKYVEQQPRDKYNPATHTVPPASYPQVLLDVDAESSEQHDQDARYHLWVYFFRNWFTGTTKPDDCVGWA
jgi:hypothetical protein